VIAARALTVGLICALLHNAIVISGDFIGLHYALSLTISFAIVVVVGYWLHSGWTFRGAKRGGSSFARYVLVASANYPASLAGMFLLVDLMALSVPLASPLLTVVLFAVNFLGNRWALRASRSGG
jgi:putative flippase GtrA